MRLDWVKSTAAFIGIASCVIISQQAQAATSFAGRTIHLVINFTPGGAVDSFFRLLTPALEKHLPGNPKVVVENRPGAGGRLAASYLYNVAKPDGLTIGGMAGIANDVFATEDVKYDTTKFTWLGAVPQTQVMLIRRDLGVNSAADLPARELILAETGDNSNNFIASALALRLMGVKFRAVQGYPGQTNTIQAVRQGEASATDVGAPFYLPNKDAWEREGVFHAILQRGDMQEDGSFMRSPLLPDIATMPEAITQLNPRGVGSVEFAAYRMIAATYALQYALIAPPNLPADVMQALRDGLATALGDPETVATIKDKLQLTYNFVPGARAAALIAKLPEEATARPDAQELIRKMSAPK